MHDSRQKKLPVIPLLAFILLSLATGPALTFVTGARLPSSRREWAMVGLQAAVLLLLPLVLLHNARVKRSSEVSI